MSGDQVDDVGAVSNNEVAPTTKTSHASSTRRQDKRVASDTRQRKGRRTMRYEGVRCIDVLTLFRLLRPIQRLPRGPDQLV